MKLHRKLLSMLLALCLILSLGTVAYAASYSGDAVYPGLSGILPEDDITLPDNTIWATLTASWGVWVRFVDWDEREIKSELVPVSDDVPGTSHAPEDPTRVGYTFTGWERYDENGDTNVTLHDDGSVTDVTGPGPIVFIATYERNVGSLTISNIVTGNLGDKTKDFTFTVKFDVDGTFNYTGSSSGTITSGGTITLKHGESITITDIPAGAHYSITESGNRGYSVYANGATGIIAEKTTSTAKFTNSRSNVPKTGDNSHLTMWLCISGIAVLGMVGTQVNRNKKRRKGRTSDKQIKV